MGDLTAAHRGYEYQDLLEACRLVDMLLGMVVAVHVDEKLVLDDRFDDLTAMNNAGLRERTQFKHTDNDDHSLSLATFTTDARGLRLDRLVAAAVADRDGPGSSAAAINLRIIMRDAGPEDAALKAVMIPADASHAPFLPGMTTNRLRFDAEALWRGVELPARGRRRAGNVFAFLREGGTRVAKQDLEWLCRHLVVEVSAPPMTMDLHSPGPAEQLLLRRVRDELGAGVYPNEHRSVVDVAEALIRTVRAARQGGIKVTVGELLRRTQLRHDFGAVAREHPVDPALEVRRTHTVEALVQSATVSAEHGGVLLAVGPPGQGKSWVCQQVVNELTSDGWLVAEHYCYLGDADGDRLPRVMSQSIFGSLLARLAEADPGLVRDQRPRYAADEETLTAAVTTAVQTRPDRRVALVVDGIDHVTRVRGASRNLDPSFDFAEALSSLQLPPGSVLVVLSQPGGHLAPLEQGDATTVSVPPLSTSELRRLAERLGIVNETDDSSDALITNGNDAESFLTALEERSAGNALYARYLCREVALRPGAISNAAGTIRALPAYDGTLEGYYAHVYQALGAEADVVADVIALLDMPVTRNELSEILPHTAHRIDRALNVLAPVLLEMSLQGGIRVYHESFARYLRLGYKDAPDALTATLEMIASWLSEKGLFVDARAFRCLFRILREAGRDAEVVELIGRDFVSRAVSAGFPASGIRENLATGLGCAARSQNWPAVVRCVELSRAAGTYQDERFDSLLVEYADVPMALIGSQTVADRLLHDGRTVMAARAGLQMCAAVDAAGAIAPWREYLEAYQREAETDNTSYGRDSDREVELAVLRGRLRVSAERSAEAIATGKDDSGQPLSIDLIAEWLDGDEQKATDNVVDMLLQSRGIQPVVTLISQLKNSGEARLIMAERVASGAAPEEFGSELDWAVSAASHGLAPGSLHRLLALGMTAEDILGTDVGPQRERLANLTHEVQQEDARWKPQIVGEWLDALAAASRVDALGLSAAEVLVKGLGWYPCWLRFVIGLVRAEAAETSESSALALGALRFLTGDLRPFEGAPRSCDLFSLHPLIAMTVQRAVALLNDTDWPTALEFLTRVSNSITVTLRGEPSGPLPPDLLLKIALEGATPARRASVEALAQSEFDNGAGRRFYSDLAGYRLIHARLALATGESDKARSLWLDACRFLAAYGWHKDITIYEILDPLPSLIAADPVRGRHRVACVQPLCERVPWHTDLDETRAAWGRWWELLAIADPVALAELAAQEMLDECNDPNALLHEARTDLWTKWHEEADPVVATALWLTLDVVPEAKTVPALGQLAEAIAGSPSEEESALLRWALSRADERLYRHDDKTSPELEATDQELVSALNSVAESANAPRIRPLPQRLRDESRSRDPYLGEPKLVSVEDRLTQMILPDIPPGPAGLLRAIRAWHHRQDRTASEQAFDRMTNIIGYRLLELAEAGRADEAAQILHTIARPTDLREGALLLGQVAKGLDMHGQPTLAAEAYALAWSHTRGQGGWLNFGGETSIESLRRATQLDSEIALQVIAQETERIVASGPYGTYGITQALIFAFTHQALAVKGSPPIDLAFALWDEAAAVIAERAPRVHDSDDPKHRYIPPRPDSGATVLGDLNQAFATATLAGLAHPGRENKRRSLLAVRALMSRRPAVAAPAISLALAHLSDPATLTWLLSLLKSHKDPDDILTEQTVGELKKLAQGPLLPVRALARELLPDAQQIPLGPSDPGLLATPSPLLWTPTAEQPHKLTGDEEVILAPARFRLNSAENLHRGFTEAVLNNARQVLDSGPFRERLSSQLDAYRSRGSQRWPDAYLATEETVEDTVQKTAAGIRAFRIQNGLSVPDPAVWERHLAEALTDAPHLPLAFEASRWPRPDIEPPPAIDDHIWTAAGPHQTLQIEPVDQAQILGDGPLTGWRILGSVERQIFPAKRQQDDGHVTLRFTGAEVRAPSDLGPLGTLPFTNGDLRAWLYPPTWQAGVTTTLSSQPLLGLDGDMVAAKDSRHGLGVPLHVIAPTAPLCAALELSPATPFTLNDDAGPALALILWRTHYDRSDYYLAWPRVTGCAIAVRPDLLTRISQAASEPVFIRSFVARTNWSSNDD